jgi:hypothetical protein
MTVACEATSRTMVQGSSREYLVGAGSGLANRVAFRITRSRDQQFGIKPSEGFPGRKKKRPERGQGFRSPILGASR